MSYQRPTENILNFRRNFDSLTQSPQATLNKPSPKKLHKSVRRRRLLWLVGMTLFIVWAVVEIAVQQFRVWDREDKYAKKVEQLRIVQAETAKLKASISQLNTEDYLIELAHKLGYSHPDEENYQLKPVEKRK